METTSRAPLQSYWRPIAVVLVALLLGGVVGVLIEHRRAVNESNSGSAPSPTPTAAPSAWFSDTSAACPAVQKWYGALGSAIYLVLGTQPWETIRAGVLSSWAAMADQYRAMVPLANAAGKSELQFMLASLDQDRSEINAAPSAAAFRASPKPPTIDRLSRDIVLLLQTAKSCTT